MVAGLPFNVNGLDPAPAQPSYTWQLGDFPSGTFRWEFTSPTGLFGMTTLKNNGLPKNNADFGDAHGVVKLSSVSESTLSTDAYLNKKVKVFCKKDDMNPNTFFPNQEPNWSYYWEQFVEKKKILSLNYATTERMILECNSSTAIACIPGRPPTRNVYYRQLISEKPGYTDVEGIHAFVVILSHENQHFVLWDLFWPNGYLNDVDNDFDQDKYPNWFEKSEEGINAGFNWTEPHDCYVCKVPKTQNNPNGWSVGRIYEENICIEVQKHENVNLYDGIDWSFDIFNLYQGKRWKY